MPSKSTGRRGNKRRKYSAPRITSQKIYERYGLACTKEQGNLFCLKKGVSKS